ncbi:CRISPR-associated helicase Cas3' [Chamaesiphon sp. VAR_48_metabat_135_sub]|uniref:CRISPR-associated helicase Cas3' n=1 Tax=Chamaesiphon sp. VAR_48_metabat_135_sub TaxID=2964699 RepID=UPI00286C9E12|nr:CRISPR-associated helicase Cas3' [Chamaesiphon sp. VAR_48_metabat_135_sub]
MQPKLSPDLLLAKSFNRDEETWQGANTLVGHTIAVIDAVTTIATCVGDQLIVQFGLTCSFEYLLATARLAAYLHDWGKANHHFQQVVRKQRNPLRNPQMIRHEVASVLIAWEFREWLMEADGDFYVALAAAGGHHLKLGGRSGKKTNELGELRIETGDTELYLYTSHPNFKALLKYGVRAIKLPRKIKLSHKPASSWSVSEIKHTKREEIRAQFDRWQPDPVLLAVVKSLLVAGDAIGSALPPQGIDIKTWIEGELQQTLTAEKLDRVISSRLKPGESLFPFQIALGESTARVTLARAGCGTGKTVGAYNWAKHHAIDRKLIFCYPTTGTSTEGFIDYVHNKLDSVLLHSRANVDLQGLKSTGEEIDAGDGAENETALKLESFKAWGKESIVCTVDTVLGMLQCNRRPMYLFPTIAQAAFVFDEVHCYDNSLFGALLRFLEVVKAPILLMSASVQPWQLEAIQKAIGEPVKILAGATDLEQQPRYRFHYADAPNWERVEQELATGGKVLWVCNQVNTAIGVYLEAKEKNLNAVLYHSRYCYGDRVKHHRAVVDGFEPDRPPILAIATQVAEMSLDLSATLLVSQIADPAGLIQRLGRLNRRYCGRALDALFYPDGVPGYPYHPDRDLAEGLRLIQSCTGDVNQGQLAEWLEQSDIRGKPDLDSVLLDGKWRTYPTSLREAGYTTTVLLQEDVIILLDLFRCVLMESYLRLRGNPRYLYLIAKGSTIQIIKSLSTKLLSECTVPLIVDKQKLDKWERYKYYPIAPTSEWTYSTEIGAQEVK